MKKVFLTPYRMSKITLALLVIIIGIFTFLSIEALSLDKKLDIIVTDVTQE